MFSRRSGRRGRPSLIGSLGQSIRSRWSQSNVERIVSHKQGYSRRLSMELLEDRRLLTVNVYLDNVNGNISIVDDYKDDVLQTGSDGPFFTGANNVQEDNDVTLSNGVDTPGRLRITDPLGVILEPAVIAALKGKQLSNTVVEVDATGTVRVDLQGGNDRLNFSSDFNLVTTLTTLNVRGGDSAPSDVLNLTATTATAETVTISAIVDEQTITGYAGKTLQARGFESIAYRGDGNDNLIADLGFGVATARVQNSASAGTDEVISSTLPTVLFNSLNKFTLTGDAGAPTAATFVIDSLEGATNYEFDSLSADTLAIEGTGGADAISASLNVANLRVTGNVKTIETTGMDASDLLQVQTLGGNDTFTVNIASTAPILTPIFFDGGDDFDTLRVLGNPTTAIATENYTPGSQPDQGRLEYLAGGGGARLMSIDFDNLEPIVDEANATNLQVFGNGADNSITYTTDPTDPTRGLVTVDGTESIAFKNKTNLTLIGSNGNDLVVLDNPSLPTGLVNIVVNGDQLGQPNGGGNDTIRIVNLVASLTSVTANGQDGNDVIDASALTQSVPLFLNGNDGDDTIIGSPGNDTIKGGVGNDTIVVSSGTDNVDGETGADTLKVLGNAAANNVTVTATSATVLTFAGNLVTGATTVANLEEFRVELGDNNDQLTVDLPNTQLITAFPIFYDGGTGQNTLTVQGAFGGASIDNITYTPGLQPDEGRLLYTDAAQVMDVTFDNLRPIVDTAAAAQLVVNGNGASNAITAVVDPAAADRVLVSIDGFETVSFKNKTNLTLNALGGDDIVIVNIAAGATPAGLTSVTVNGDAGNDTVRLESLPTAVTTALVNDAARAGSGDGNDTIDATNIAATVALTLNGGAGNDIITGGAGNDTISGGTGDDIIVVSSGTDNVDGGTGADTLKVLGDAAANNVTVQATTASILTFSGNLVTGATTVANLEEFRVELGDNNDQLTVDLPNAQLITAFPIFYDGGTGQNTLTVQGAFGGGANSIDNVTYTPGLQPDEGRIVYTDAAQVMDITFDNLRPIVDTAAAAQLVVNGNGSANSMTVVIDPAAADRALVSVDGFETISFKNKTNLTLNALGGDDTVVVDIAAGANPAGLTSVTVNGDAGNDTVRLESLPTAVTTALVNDAARPLSGDGNDTIDATNIAATVALTLNGGAGDDTITGGKGTDTISGGTGNDVIVASPGNDVMNGDADDDQIKIIGSILNDTITVNQTLNQGVANNVTVTVTKNGATSTRVYSVNTMELVYIDGGLGDDLVALNVVDNVAPASSLPFHVVGNAPNAGGDRLIFNDDGQGDLIIHRQGPDGRSGSIVLGSTTVVGGVNTTTDPPKMKATYEGIERVDITPIDTMGRTGDLANVAIPNVRTGQLVVFHYDDFESNDAEVNATPVGPKPIFMGLRNIDPGPVTLPVPFPTTGIPGDSDWYEFRPDKIGTFRFSITFEQIDTVPDGRPGLPFDGNLKIEVYTASGAFLGSSDVSVNTPINIKTSESFDFSAAANTSYYLRVVSSDVIGPAGTVAPAINNYELNVSEVDLEGPQVTNVFLNNRPDLDIFAAKPTTQGAMPLVYSITVNLQDLPIPRLPGNPYPTLDAIVAAQVGLYSVVGDHVGNVAIESVKLLHNYQFNATVTTAPVAGGTTFTASGLVNAAQQPVVGDYIVFSDGPGLGVFRTITAYDRTTGVITVDAPFTAPFVPAVGNTFQITSFPNASVVLNFAKALPDDRYTLTILDGLTDPAGNELDGESNADEPQHPTFPSGNTIAGGNFVARFTVDSRPEIGATVAGDIDIDINGNNVWDPSNGQIGNDATNVDLSFQMLTQLGINGPITSGAYNVNDLLFSGRFTPAANSTLPTSGKLFDQLGAFGFASDVGSYRWLIDTDGNGVITIAAASGDKFISLSGGANPVVLGVNVAGAIPIAGNFDNIATNGDEIGLYINGRWLLDTNHDFILDQVLAGTSMLGSPVVGDFDGNGSDDLAVFNNNVFSFDMNRDGTAESSLVVVWGYPGVLDKPIATDMDQDGVDDIGLWVPRNSATLPREVSEWYFLVSGRPTGAITVTGSVGNPSATTTNTIIVGSLKGNNKIAVGDTFKITSGAFAGTTRSVTAFNSATGEITFSGAALATVTSASVPPAPALKVGDTVVIDKVAAPGTNFWLNHPFNTTPFGNDIYAEFGDELALPILGNFDPPASATVFAPGTGVAGDYDNNGAANISDYTVWRGTFGSNTSLLADGNHSGQVDAGDFVLWRKSAGANASGSSLAASGTGMALEVDIPSTVSSMSASVGVQEVSSASATSSTLEGDSTSIGITTTIETVSIAAPRVAAPAANLAVLDSAFSNMATESPKKDVGASISPNFSTFDDNLLLLGMADYSQRPMTLPLGSSADEAPASDNDAFDSALTDFAAETVLELAI